MAEGCWIIDLNINSKSCWACWWMTLGGVREKRWPSVLSFSPSRPLCCTQITLFYPIKGDGWAWRALSFFAPWYAPCSHLDARDISALSLEDVERRMAVESIPCFLRLMQWISCDTFTAIFTKYETGVLLRILLDLVLMEVFLFYCLNWQSKNIS